MSEEYAERPDLLEVGRALFGSELVCVLEEEDCDGASIYEGGISLGTASRMRFEFSDGRILQIWTSEWGGIGPPGKP